MLKSVVAAATVALPLASASTGATQVAAVVEKFALNNGNFFMHANRRVAKNAIQQFYGGVSAPHVFQAFVNGNGFSPWDTAYDLAEEISYYQQTGNFGGLFYFDYAGGETFYDSDFVQDYGQGDDTYTDSYIDNISDGGEDQYDNGNMITIYDSTGKAPILPYTQDYTTLYTATAVSSYTTYKLPSGKAWLFAAYASDCSIFMFLITGETGFDNDGFMYVYDFTDSSGDFAVFTKMTCCDDGTLTHMIFVPMTGMRFTDDWFHTGFMIENTTLSTYGYYTYGYTTDDDFDWVFEGNMVTATYGTQQAGKTPTNPAVFDPTRSHLGACTIYYLLFMGKKGLQPYDGETDDYAPAFRDSTLEAIADAFVDAFDPAWWK